jgi:hypothetical protein
VRRCALLLAVFNQALHVGGDHLFRCLPLLRLSGVSLMGVTVLGVVFMGVSSLALAVAFHAMRGMYLHAERLLAKAGRQGARGGVSPTRRGS